MTEDRPRFHTVRSVEELTKVLRGCRFDSFKEDFDKREQFLLKPLMKMAARRWECRAIILCKGDRKFWDECVATIRQHLGWDPSTWSWEKGASR